MNSHRLAGVLVLLGAASSLPADDRAGSITILPPPPSIMDWHAGNRHWNLEGARHIHLPSERGHGHVGHHRFGKHHRSFGVRGHGFGLIGPSYYAAPGYWHPSYYGYSIYPYSVGVGYPYSASNGLDYFTSLGYSLHELNAVLQAHRNGAAAAPAAAREPEPRSSHPQAQARARRFQQQGDRQFRQRNYARAYQLYRSARRAAPDLAEVHVRMAQALTALGRYTSAVTAIQRSLRVDPGWLEGDFDLMDLYGDDPLPLLSHKERLAMALRDDMDNPDLLFLLGYQLFFSGERAKARPFFERAMQLTGDPGHIVPFLEVPVEALAEEEPDGGNGGEQAPAPPVAPAEEKVPRNGTRREI